MMGGAIVCVSSSITMELRWATRSTSNGLNKFLPLYVSANPSHTHPPHLRDLFQACNHSCYRFPIDAPSLDPIDIHKLRTALSHSSVLVSVFCKPQDMQITPLTRFSDLFQRSMPVSPFNGQLVGFGRAVSDLGLTASIYDVMVIPSLRRMGIGRMIVQRITRMLASRDIYDIAALCSEEERLFFEACGFGDDILGSTTMMYTRTVSTSTKGNDMVKQAGRKLLLGPPLREPFASSEASRIQES